MNLRLKKFKFTYKDKTYDVDFREIKSGTVSSLNADSLTRDFTVNGMYYDVVNNKVYDNFKHFDAKDTLSDIKKGVIMWNRYQRSDIFKDPTRILRAFRFKNKLKFKFDPQLKTYIKIRGYSLLISYTRKMRIIREMGKIFESRVSAECLEDLIDYSIFDLFISPIPSRNINPFYIERKAVSSSLRLYNKIEKFYFGVFEKIEKEEKELDNIEGKFQRVKKKLVMEKVVHCRNELRKLVVILSCCRSKNGVNLATVNHCITASQHFFVKKFCKNFRWNRRKSGKRSLRLS